MREEATTRTLYKFKELSAEVQAKAIEQARESAGENFDGAECVCDDAATVADLMGLEIGRREWMNSYSFKGTSPTIFYSGFWSQGLEIGRREWMNSYGFKGTSPTIFYSGFWSQGDGACFEGSYSYKKGSVKAVKDYAPQDETLHQIALDLQHAQAANFYRVTASIKHRGHYYHSGCMSVDLENSGDSYQEVKNEDDFIQAFRDFADWIYDQLKKAYDWETSAENARDYLENNDEEYTADGAPSN